MGIQASRSRPPEVAPVVHEGIRYEQHGIGCLRAFQVGPDTELWTLRIYEVKRDPNLEGDVQDRYFARMELLPGKNQLLIENEARATFIVDLRSRSVSPTPSGA